MKLTDGGIETILIFHQRHRPAVLRRLRPAPHGRGHGGAPRATSSPTWRSPASTALAFVLDAADLARQPRLGRRARLLAGRAGRRQPARGRARCTRSARHANRRTPIVISGVRSARAATATSPTTSMTAEEAEAYHARRSRLRRRRRRPRHRADDDLRRGGDRDRARRASGRHAGRRSPSPSRPTAGCRAASRWARRSSRSTPRPTAAPPTSWSTAPTRRTSPTCSRTAAWADAHPRPARERLHA